jgi:8-oxo-dGTP pyrophosphatase MutT (NUDIX family)
MSEARMSPVLSRSDGTLIVPSGDTHRCHYPSGWEGTYSHMTVATILERSGLIALIKRPDREPAEGGKLALPGGYVEQGDTLAKTVIEETRQETGYTIRPGTLRMFALMDGPTTLPGRQNEESLNIVTVFTAEADEQVQEPDHEVEDLLWRPPSQLGPLEKIAFGHFDIVRMYLRHQEQPFDTLPIVPSTMRPDQLFLPQ